MGPLGWLTVAGTALAAPQAIEKTDEILGDLWGIDWLGRRGRQARMRAEDAVAMMLDNNEMEGRLWKEQNLAGALAPFEGIVGVPEIPGFRNVEDQRGLMSILQREKEHLGRIAEVDQGPDFEALALQLGY